MLKTFTNALRASTNQDRARQELRVCTSSCILVHFHQEKLNSLGIDLLSVNHRNASEGALIVVSDEHLVR